MNMFFNYGFIAKIGFMNFIRFGSFVDLIVSLVNKIQKFCGLMVSLAKLDQKVLETKLNPIAVL